MAWAGFGTRSLSAALAVADRVASPAARDAGLRLAGATTHFATADEDPEFLAVQLAAFDPFARALRERGDVLVHAANSAATLREPASHYDMVRCGIAVYGCDPFGSIPIEQGLEPALELSSYVAAVKLARAGESAGYGRRFIAERDTWIATIPIGYADGVNRALTNNCDVLIGGRRYPLAGTVSMDNITVDLGPEPARGDRRRRDPDRPLRRRAQTAEDVVAASRDDRLRGDLRDLGPGDTCLPP